MTVENRDDPNGNNGVFTLTAQYDPSNPQAWKMNKTRSTRHIGYQDFPDNEEFRFDFTPSWKGWKWNAEHSYVPKWGGQYHDNGGTVSAKWIETHYWRPTEYSAWIPYTIEVEIVWLPQAETPYLVTPARTKIVTSDYGDWNDEDPYAYNNGDSSSESQYKIVAPRILRGSTVFSVENHVFPSGEIDTTTHYWRVGADESPVFPLISPNNGYAWAALVEPTIELAVDADRDGQIKFPSEDSSDQTAFGTPYCFWLNDDIDRIHTFPDSAADTMANINENEQDDIGPTEAATNNWQADWKDNVANSRRDLEDFTRIVVSTSGIADALKNGDLYLGLKWTDSVGTPAVKLYKQYDAAGDTSYLTDEFKASLQQPEPAILNARYASDDPVTSAHTLVEPGELFVLPQGVWLGLSGDTLKRTLLFEGCKAGKGQLKLVIVKRDGSNYTEIGEGSGVWMDLKSIGDMYEHWSVGNASGGLPLPGPAGRVAAETGSGSAFSYSANSPEEQKYVLFVHGWNMEKWEKERFAETAYKRLWWQGYKGRFGLFSWPCTNRFDETKLHRKVIEGISDGTHFDRGEWTAWRTGAQARQIMQTLHTAYNGELYVFSHSMGGIVVSEALRLQSQANGSRIVKVYVASQAALSAHLYDGTSTSSVQWTYAHPSFAPFPAVTYGPQTPNVYPNWFAFLLGGGGGGSSSVGRLVNFYNANDWALAAPVWQFNQITKPDWPDTGLQPWRYSYAGDPQTFNDVFVKTEGDSGSNLTALHLGTRADPLDRYEIMAFAAESPVKAFGASANISQGINSGVDLRASWGVDPEGGDHKSHKWHSGEFRSTIHRQRNYWKVILSDQAFDISTVTLP